MAKDSKILLVDDSAFMRNVLKNILQGAGYSNFVEAGDGNEAVEKFKSESPELVLLDIIMPVKGKEPSATSSNHLTTIRSSLR